MRSAWPWAPKRETLPPQSRLETALYWFTVAVVLGFGVFALGLW